jgi:hypothetical protein
MTFETDLFALLKTVSPRVFPDFAPTDTPRPYVTFQQVGGAVLNPLGNEGPGVRLPEVQVNVWSDSRAGAMTLIRAIEAAMRGATAFTARPMGDAVADYDADVPVYGCRQDFLCRHSS